MLFARHSHMKAPCLSDFIHEKKLG